jgi:hypothetical protein
MSKREALFDVRCSGYANKIRFQGHERSMVMATQWLRMVSSGFEADSCDWAICHKLEGSGRMNCRSSLATGSAAGEDIRRILYDRSKRMA